AIGIAARWLENRTGNQTYITTTQPKDGSNAISTAAGLIVRADSRLRLALIVPSGCAIAVMPTNELSWMSDIAPFTVAMTGAPSLSWTVVGVPLRVLIVSMLPFT